MPTEFGEAGVAVVQLLPVGSSDVQGVAAIERAALQRELDITPTSVRIILSTDAGQRADRSGGGVRRVRPGRALRVAEHRRASGRAQEPGRAIDVTPFKAVSAETGDPVTVAYYGAPGAPGFGLAAAYTDAGLLAGHR